MWLLESAHVVFLALKKRERKTAARATIEIGDTTEKSVNVNETTPESVYETVPAEISSSTLAVEKLMRLLI